MPLAQWALTQEVFEPLNSFSTPLEQTRTRGDLTCVIRLEAIQTY